MRMPDFVFVYHLSAIHAPALDAPFLGDLLLDHPDERFDALRRLRAMGFALSWSTAPRDDGFRDLQLCLPESGLAMLEMIDDPACMRVNFICNLNRLLMARVRKQSADA